MTKFNENAGRPSEFWWNLEGGGDTGSMGTILLNGAMSSGDGLISEYKALSTVQCSALDCFLMYAHIQTVIWVLTTIVGNRLQLEPSTLIPARLHAALLSLLVYVGELWAAPLSTLTLMRSLPELQVLKAYINWITVAKSRSHDSNAVVLTIIISGLPWDDVQWSGNIGA